MVPVPWILKAILFGEFVAGIVFALILLLDWFCDKVTEKWFLDNL